jgi:hypothetical protein
MKGPCILILFAALQALARAEEVSAPPLRKVASIPFKKPAFVTAHSSPVGDRSMDLIVSSFGVGFPGQNPDGVHFIPDIASAVKSNEYEFQRIASRVVWPNEVNLLDQRHLIVPGGFLVPGKKGHISSLDYVKYREDPTTTDWVKLVDDKKGFYHRVEMANVYNKAAKEGDSGERLISCRGWKGIFNGGSGEMVYLEPTGNETYEARVIEQGCDCYFVQVDLNNDGIMEFIVPAFFSSKLFLMWTEHPLGDYSQRSYVRQRIIDDTIGMPFDVQHVDLDNDGVPEILLTNHESGKGKVKPSLFVYKVEHPQVNSLRFQGKKVNNYDLPISEYMESLKFTRTTISSNFTIINKSFMAAGPGGAQTFYPTPDESGKPFIVVSGDGSEKAYVFYPKSDALADYGQIEVHDCKGTVGGILVGDLDNDGYKELVIPCYDTNTIELYTFKP